MKDQGNTLSSSPAKETKIRIHILTKYPATSKVVHWSPLTMPSKRLLIHPSVYQFTNRPSIHPFSSDSIHPPPIHLPICLRELSITIASIHPSAYPSIPRYIGPLVSFVESCNVQTKLYINPSIHPFMDTYGLFIRISIHRLESPAGFLCPWCARFVWRLCIPMRATSKENWLDFRA